MAEDGRAGSAGSAWPAPGDILIALAFLTRIPAPVDHGRAGARAAAAAWAWPVAGAVVGGASGLVFAAAAALGAPAGFAAALAVAAGLLLTGALHEDGLADFADGAGGGATRERRLEIMRDSRIGTYGAAALTLALVARWSLVAALPPAAAAGALAAAAAVGRGWAAAALRLATPARADGLGAAAGRPAAATAGLCALAALGIAAALSGATPALTALALAAAVTVAVHGVARRALGGATGDVHGAAIALAELVALAALCA